MTSAKMNLNLRTDFDQSARGNGPFDTVPARDGKLFTSTGIWRINIHYDNTVVMTWGIFFYRRRISGYVNLIPAPSSCYYATTVCESVHM